MTEVRQLNRDAGRMNEPILIGPLIARQRHSTLASHHWQAHWKALDGRSLRARIALVG